MRYLPLIVVVVLALSACNGTPAPVHSAPSAPLPILTAPDPGPGLLGLGKDATKAATGITTETASQRAAIAALQSADPQAPVQPVAAVLAAADNIDAFAKVVGGFETRIADLNTQLQKGREECVALQKAAQAQKTALDAANKAGDAKDAQIVKLRADAADAFQKRLRAWAVVCVLGFMACLGLGIYLTFFAGSVKGGMLMFGLGGTLLASAGILTFLAAYWVWVMGVSAAAGVAMIVYLIIQRHNLTTIKTDFGAVVKGVADATPEAAAAVKASIATAADEVSSIDRVRKTVDALKAELGILSQPVPLAGTKPTP